MKQVFYDYISPSRKKNTVMLVLFCALQILLWLCFTDLIIFNFNKLQTLPIYQRVIINVFSVLFFSMTILFLFKSYTKKLVLVSDELKKSLKLQSMMLENMEDVAWILDLRSQKFKYVSPSVIKLRGYTAAEIMNQPLKAALTEDSYERVLSKLPLLINAYESGDDNARTGTEKVSQPCKDGSIVETEVLISLVKNSAGQVSEIIGVTRNISERKLIQEKLSESEFWISESQRIGQIGSYILDLRSGLWDCSPVLDEILGTDHSIEKNMDGWFSVVHPEDMEGLTQYYYSVVKDKSFFDYEYRIIRKNDQQERFVRGRGEIVLDEVGNLRKMIGTVQDITEHKYDLLLVQESERKYRAIIETSLNGFFIIDKTGSILEVNDAYCKMSGYSREKLLKMNLSDLEFNQEPGQIQNHLKKIIKYGSDKYETRHETIDGMIISMEASITFSPQNNGIFYCFMNDLTDKNQMLHELVLAKDEAERSNRVKSEFLAQMSHEIRSPMNVTLSFTNFIKEELGNTLAPELVESFAAVDTSARRIIRTIDLILNMSEMQLGTYEPTWKSFDLIKDILKNVCNEYEFYAKQKGLQLNFGSNVSVAKIYGDSYSVTQIFVNLIDNAIKYSNSGSVYISVEKDEQKNLKAIVEDNGIGMSEEFLAKIFEPFTQETQGYSRRFEGNGLGLALVKKYCDLNNADISVESEKGKGTRFTVVFHRLMKLNVAVD
jgi:PAS domain S-box-containing protein